jgi:hypothetical protein
LRSTASPSHLPPGTSGAAPRCWQAVRGRCFLPAPPAPRLAGRARQLVEALGAHSSLARPLRPLLLCRTEVQGRSLPRSYIAATSTAPIYRKPVPCSSLGAEAGKAGGSQPCPALPSPVVPCCHCPAGAAAAAAPAGGEPPFPELTRLLAPRAGRLGQRLHGPLLWRSEQQQPCPQEAPARQEVPAPAQERSLLHHPHPVQEAAPQEGRRQFNGRQRVAQAPWPAPRPLAKATNRQLPKRQAQMCIQPHWLQNPILYSIVRLQVLPACCRRAASCLCIHHMATACRHHMSLNYPSIQAQAMLPTRLDSAQPRDPADSALPTQNSCTHHLPCQSLPPYPITTLQCTVSRLLCHWSPCGFWKCSAGCTATSLAFAVNSMYSLYRACSRLQCTVNTAVHRTAVHPCKHDCKHDRLAMLQRVADVMEVHIVHISAAPQMRAKVTR